MSGWRTVRVPRALLDQSPKLRAWQKDVHDGHLSVFAGPEPAGFHLSISHRTNASTPQPGRYPTWGEIVDARYRFAPLDVTMAMLLPPQDQYVNHHDTTFHLHQIKPEDEEHVDPAAADLPGVGHGAGATQ